MVTEWLQLLPDLRLQSLNRNTQKIAHIAYKIKQIILNRIFNTHMLRHQTRHCQLKLRNPLEIIMHNVWPTCQDILQIIWLCQLVLAKLMPTRNYTSVYLYQLGHCKVYPYVSCYFPSHSASYSEQLELYYPHHKSCTCLPTQEIT